MPYIPESNRQRAEHDPDTVGELNFALTKLMIAAFRLNATPMALNLMKHGMNEASMIYFEKQPKNYDAINDVLGAFAGAIMEFRRRTSKLGPKFGQRALYRSMIAKAISQIVDGFYERNAAAYEDGKIVENGDVYPANL